MTISGTFPKCATSQTMIAAVSPIKYAYDSIDSIWLKLYHGFQRINVIYLFISFISSQCQLNDPEESVISTVAYHKHNKTCGERILGKNFTTSR